MESYWHKFFFPSLVSYFYDYEPTEEEMNLVEQIENVNKIDDREWICNQGLKYIAGYVAYQFRDKYSFLGNPTRDLGLMLDNSEYIIMLSRGDLMYPSEEFIKVANIMDDVFEEFHGLNQLKPKTKHIFQKMADLVMEKNDFVPRDALLCLMRTRTYIRLRKWNMEIREENKFKKTRFKK